MRRRILLAENDPATQKITKVRLEHEGYEVLVATDGEETLQKLTSNGSVDLLLLDLKMPKLDGLEICRRLKSKGAHAQIPIIIFSGSPEYRLGLPDLCLDLGVEDWIEKPFHSEALMQKIRAVLKQHAGTKHRGSQG